VAPPLPCRLNHRAIAVQQLENLDLSRLNDHLVFHSSSPSEVRTKLGDILSEHDLTLGNGRVNTTLFQRKLNDISVMKLTYGAEVNIEASPFKGFSLVQTPLRGSFEVEIDGYRKTFGPGDVAVLSAQHNLGIHWQEGSEQLILKVPHHLMRQHFSSGTPFNTTQTAAGFTSPAFKLDDSLNLIWHSLVQQAIDLPNGAGSLNSLWLAHFEQTIALFLLTHQTTNTGKPGVSHYTAVSNSAARGNPAPLERMERYIRQRLCAPISLADLALAAGLSPRSLNALCHKYYGVSPMVLLRNIRLDAVREKLQTCPGANVTSVALDHGFGHLGRFSAYYREQFGELPRDTTSNQFLPCM
jgi:AraC-like DNA-binding protein